QPMNLVDKKDVREPSGAQCLPGSLEHLTDVLHSRGYRRKRVERPMGELSDDGSESGFPRAGRAPKDESAPFIRLQELSEAVVEEVRLPNHPFQRARPLALGQRSGVRRARRK